MIRWFCTRSLGKGVNATSLNLSAGAPAAVPKKLRRKLEQRNAAMYDELRQRRERGTQLKAVLSHMEAEKHAMGKGRKRKVQDAAGGQPAVYKFKRQRQK